jgi:site-specific recombinase XerC
MPNPALLYLLSLAAKTSRATTKFKLEQVALLDGLTVDSYPWNDLDPIKVQTIVAKLEESGLSYSTVNAFLSAIKGVAKQAWRNGDMEGDVLTRIKDIPHRKGYRLPAGQALDKNVVETLLEHAQANPVELLARRDVALIALGFYCGFRRSELGSIKMKQLDLTMGEVKIIGKGNKERKIPIATKALPFINEWLLLRQEWISEHGVKGEHLFGQINARWESKIMLVNLGGLSGNAVRVILNKLCLSSGIAFDQLPTPHDMRRTAITGWLQKGDARLAQALAGHEHIQTTMGYARDDLTDRLRQIVEDN